MDIEKTIAFILETEARTDARLDRVSEKLDALAERQKKADARMDRFERSLNGIRKLIQTGMKLVVGNQQAIKELAIAQKQTDRRLNAFIASLEKGRNGRERR